jgi:hypothetical protein
MPHYPFLARTLIGIDILKAERERERDLMVVQEERNDLVLILTIFPCIAWLLKTNFLN